jgi:hypothetical protein
MLLVDLREKRWVELDDWVSMFDTKITDGTNRHGAKVDITLEDPA